MKSIFFALLVCIIFAACSGTYSSIQDTSENAKEDSTRQDHFWNSPGTDPYLEIDERPEEVVVPPDPRASSIQPPPRSSEELEKQQENVR